ncbi:hypothetical protein CF319_g7996 [Tilletia indica]|nr:hypothetical protein CF319_g7996 [Tilletia indica]
MVEHLPSLFANPASWMATFSEELENSYWKHLHHGTRRSIYGAGVQDVKVLCSGTSCLAALWILRLTAIVLGAASLSDDDETDFQLYGITLMAMEAQAVALALGRYFESPGFVVPDSAFLFASSSPGGPIRLFGSNAGKEVGSPASSSRRPEDFSGSATADPPLSSEPSSTSISSSFAPIGGLRTFKTSSKGFGAGSQRWGRTLRTPPRKTSRFRIQIAALQRLLHEERPARTAEPIKTEELDEDVKQVRALAERSDPPFRVRRGIFDLPTERYDCLVYKLCSLVLVSREERYLIQWQFSTGH